jgi:hypothetical protein
MAEEDVVETPQRWTAPPLPSPTATASPSATATPSIGPTATPHPTATRSAYVAPF